jgi:hypothetical protein
MVTMLNIEIKMPAKIALIFLFMILLPDLQSYLILRIRDRAAHIHGVLDRSAYPIGVLLRGVETRADFV